MQCQFCGATATVHLTDIANKKKRETHLCEGCARKHNLLPSGPGPQLNLQALLHLIMGQPTPTGSDSMPVDPSSLVCPACGIAYPQNPVVRPTLCGHGIEHGPPAPDWRQGQKLTQFRCPARQMGRNVGSCARLVVTFAGRRGSDNDDKIERGSACYRIVHHMGVAPKPKANIVSLKGGRQ